MKITKRQIRRIIREAYSTFDPFHAEFNKADYDRGYYDGIDGSPPAQDGGIDYNAGYKDGQYDRDIPSGRVSQTGVNK